MAKAGIDIAAKREAANRKFRNQRDALNQRLDQKFGEPPWVYRGQEMGNDGKL